MKIYQLGRLHLSTCAEVAPYGDLGYIVCSSCHRFQSFPKPNHRTVEWLEGSDEVCPFVWPARLVAEVLVTDAVRSALKEFGAEFLPVEFYQDPKLSKPKRVTKRNRRRVWLPYDGPPLSVLWIPRWVHADLRRSSLVLQEGCSVCGRQTYTAEGVEVRRHRWSASIKDLVEEHIPRVKDKGVYVREKDLAGVGLFRLHELPGIIVCTEKVKTRVEDKGFGNVRFLEFGSQVD